MGDIEDGRKPEPTGPVWLMLGAIIVSVVALLGDHLDLTAWPFG